MNDNDLQKFMDQQRAISKIYDISEAHINRAIANTLRAEDPEWQAKVTLLNKKKAQDPEWQKKHKVVLEELAIKSQDPEWVAARVASIKNFWRTAEGKLVKQIRNAKLAKIQEEFWNSKEGQIAREQRSESRKSYYQTKKGQAQLEKASEMRKGIPKPKVTCPHCGKLGGYPQMKQYHFDNCKQKKD